MSNIFIKNPNEKCICGHTKKWHFQNMKLYDITHYEPISTGGKRVKLMYSLRVKHI